MTDAMFGLEIILPDQILYKGRVKMLELITAVGQVGIYKGHVPMTMVLRPGRAALHEKQKILYVHLENGFAQVLPEKVTILAEKGAFSLHGVQDSDIIGMI